MRKSFELKPEKSASGKTVFVEGFANKAVADRIKDVIPGDAWKLDNFEKNPVMLFNHDPNMVIGKIVKADTNDDGLMVRGQISKSKSAQITAIRELIEEGILKTFSVGFEPGDQERDDEGKNVIKSAELLEVSVVAVPMNQESTFNVDVKSWSEKSAEEIKQEIVDACEKEMDDEEEREEEEEEEKADDCVSDKIRKLLEEGKTLDEAIAIALSVCEDREKAADPDTSEFNQGQPQVELAKQANVTLGVIAGEIRSLNEKMAELLNVTKGDKELERQMDEESDDEEEEDEEDQEKRVERLNRASDNVDRILKIVEKRFRR